MFCSNCGTQLPDDAKVCPSCGTPVTSGNEINMKEIANYAGNKAKDAFDTIVSKTAEYSSELKQKSQEMQESMERQKEQLREERIHNANNAVLNMFVDMTGWSCSSICGWPLSSRSCSYSSYWNFRQSPEFIFDGVSS